MSFIKHFKRRLQMQTTEEEYKRFLEEIFLYMQPQESYAYTLSCLNKYPT